MSKEVAMAQDGEQLCALASQCVVSPIEFAECACALFAVEVGRE